MQTDVPSKAKWIGWILLPFKAYVVIALPFYFLFRAFFPCPLWTDVGKNTHVIDPAANGLLGALVLCAPILLIGAAAQFFIVGAKAGIYTLLFAVVPTLVLAFFVLLWVAAHLL